MDAFKISYTGLKIGTHQFDFKITKEFFNSIEYSELHDGNIDFRLNLHKQERLIELDFEFSGYVNVQCGRCLTNYDQEISGKEKLFVKFGEDDKEENETVIVLSEKEHQLDITHYIYEFIILSLPYKCVHPEDEEGNSLCNPEMIERIEVHAKPESTDPRWDALKKLKNNK